MLTIDEKMLCAQLCANVSVINRPNNKIMLKTPFQYPDGDHYPIYLSETRTGGVRVSDGGHTLMHLSYENDIDKFFEGTRQLLMGQVVAQEQVGFSADSGEFFVESPLADMAEAVFRLGQAITRVYDLTFLNRSHVASTFYDDLKEQITSLVPEERVKRNYVVPGLPSGDNYPVDFYVETNGAPLYLYGIPNRDKARLTTIFLQYLNQHGVTFDSLLIFEDQQEIPRADLARLSNVGGEMISSLNAEDDFRRKLLKRAA
ncbi:MAG TPA: DUF1828 domain-containing protein [Mariprofundaceae bacterium]|nr:DUF1828 domain-containing protein [Mariprofundaceae bacterium]